MKIDPVHRAGEAKLMRTRWFDYRGLHPVTATYMFADAYRAQTLKFYESVIDIRTVEDARAFTPDDIFMSRDMTSMWLARRFADSHGLPYPFLLRFAQDRCFDRTHQRFPRPNQLYGEELEIDILLAWKDLLSRSLTYSELPHYKMKNWKGAPEQAQHARFVAAQISARNGSKVGLLARALSENILSAPLISALFSQEEADKAERYCAQYM